MLNKILLKIFGVRLISSQYGEDFIIESLLPNKKDGFYVDVGANHPIKFNNTFLFYTKGWWGINIEPNISRIKFFNILRRRDINLNVGIGKTSSEIDFHVFKESTLSTFDVDASKEYQNMGHKLKNIVKIKTVPLREILQKYANGIDIDILSIDTEGLDMQVLESNDWEKFRPRFLIIETLEYRNDGSGKKINEIFDLYLERVGYKKIADTYINTIYEKVY